MTLRLDNGVSFASGDARYLKLDQTTPQTTVGTFIFPRIVGNVSADTTNVISPIAFNLDGSGKLTASSGSQRFAAINPIINQSGTAGYEALCINATEIGTGSGDKKLLCLMRNSVGVASINSAGAITGTSLTVDTGSSMPTGNNTLITLSGATAFAGGAMSIDWYNENESETMARISVEPGSGYDAPLMKFRISDEAGTLETFLQVSSTGACDFGNNNMTTTGTLGAGATTLTGNLTFTDNLYDIGASGATRPRDLFLSRNLTIGGNAQLGDAVSDYHGINATPSSEIMLNTAQTLTTSTPGTQPASAWKLVQNLGGNNGVGAAKVGKGINFVQTITGNNSSSFNNSFNWGINFLQTDQTVASNNCIKTNWGVYSVASWEGTNSGAFALSELGGYFEGSGDFTGNNTYHFGIDCVASGTASVNYGARVNSSGATTNWGFYNISTAHNQFGIAGSNSSFGLADATVPTAKIHIGAGTATAGTAPLKFTSGTNLSVAVAGAMEFDGTQLYFSPSTTRNALIQDNGTRLTSGRVPFATTNGYLNDDADMTFATDTLTVTKLVGSTNVNTPLVLTQQIKTDTTTATDLTITTGAAKTLLLATPAYDEIQFQIASGKVPAANYPTWELMTTTCSSYAFSVDDKIDTAATELPHWWVEGTAGDAHIHFTIKTIQNSGANRFVKFTVTFAYASLGSGTLTWTETGKTAEYTVPNGTAALTHFYLDLGDLTLTGYKLGSQIQCHVKRIAATGGTEYADDVYVHQVGMHLQRDRFGSRQETTA